MCMLCAQHEKARGPCHDVLYCFHFFFFLSQGLTLYPWLGWNLVDRPGWYWTHRDPHSSASHVLELKVWATTTQPSSSYSWESLSQNPELTDWLDRGRAVRSREPQVSVPPGPGLHTYTTKPSFYMSAGYLNWALHAHVTDTINWANLLLLFIFKCPLLRTPAYLLCWVSLKSNFLFTQWAAREALTYRCQISCDVASFICN